MTVREVVWGVGGGSWLALSLRVCVQERPIYRTHWELGRSQRSCPCWTGGPCVAVSCSKELRGAHGLLQWHSGRSQKATVALTGQVVVFDWEGR